MKRVGAMLLTLLLLLTMVPMGLVSAAGNPMSLAELQIKYPDGAYWNHTGTTNKPGGYTWNPCTHHTGNCQYSGSCGCNSYNGVAIQCMGFAYQLASLAYDCDPRREWSNNTSTTALNKLKAGDIVRYKNDGHSIFVIGVEGDTVTYADCNTDHCCQIKWNQTTTKARLKASFTYVKSAPYALAPAEPAGPTLTIRYHAGGGTISAPITGYTYTVTDPDGVNLRSGAGTGNRVLLALPSGATFEVKKEDTKTANGYTWGKTTYNGTTGWVVISDFVKKTGTIRSGDYYLSDSLVYSTATGAAFVRTAGIGQAVTLDDAVALGLKKENHRFSGWCTQAEGEDPVYAWDDATLKAETFCPNLSKGSATVTLYAVWECAHTYAHACAPRCTLCGQEREVTHTYDNDCDATCNVCDTKRETAHRYAAPCAEACAVCGATREAEPHRYEEDVCTVCGSKQVKLAIVTQPKTGYAKMGETATVKVEATGDGLTYQWYLKNAGQTKYHPSSVTTASYSVVMSSKSKGRRLICYVTDRDGNQVQAKTVMLREQVSIVTQPKSATVKKGASARATVVASGDGLTYKWFVKDAGASKYVASSITKATYSVKMSSKVNGRRLICYVYDKYGKKVQAKTVTLKMK